MDFIGPIAPTSSKGNQYIIILVDYFTSNLFADAAPRATRAVVQQLLKRAAWLVGWPLAVYIVNGTHFFGADIHQTLTKKNVKSFPAARQDPELVGLSKRYVKLIMGALLKRVQQTEKVIWDTLLDAVVSSINSWVLRIHWQSPAELLFGFTLRNHGDKCLNDAVNLEGIDQEAYGLQHAELDEARDMAGGVFTAVADSREQKSDALWMPLREGDLVLVRNF